MVSAARPGGVRRFVALARRATLATLDGTGRPRLVPVCFALAEKPGEQELDPEAAVPLVLYSAVDRKPKREADPLRLARVRDLQARPQAGLLVDRWSEDWGRLAWVRLACRAEVLGVAEATGPERGSAIAALRSKYPQYRLHDLEERPLIRLTCRVTASWGDLDAEDEGVPPSRS